MDDRTATTPAQSDASLEERAVEDAPLAEDVLVEEVSIDGMCGVY